MRKGSKISVGVVIAGVLVALLVGAMLLVGSCTALLWNTMGGDSASGARRDALRAQHAALLDRLERIGSDADDLQDAARHLRTVVLPPQVLGLAIAQADSDDNRVVVLRNYEGRQTSRILVNGAGSITLEARDGTRRTFDLLEVDATLRDGTGVEIEVVLARDAVAAGPE
ncbi:hypothetical protein [Chiayiivirga flava]|uniref:Uncharacterized protein n=1 Tax=Chiayiivirga flava TaxID=659595 RepID=A0A7W8D5R0_9GAMM|nr:hypothetical protein [Chiayiivirga flava]MBB5208429.1 hypothetical protein [Chiayiivirga flava]